MNIYGLKKEKREASKRWSQLKKDREWDKAKRVQKKVQRLNREIEIKRQSQKKREKK